MSFKKLFGGFWKVGIVAAVAWSVYAFVQKDSFSSDAAAIALIERSMEEQLSKSDAPKPVDVCAIDLQGDGAFRKGTAVIRFGSAVPVVVEFTAKVAFDAGLQVSWDVLNDVAGEVDNDPAIPPFVRDIAVPREIPPPVSGWGPSPEEAEELLSQGVAALLENHAEVALKMVERAIALDGETDPGFRDYYLFRAGCMRKLGDTKAYDAFRHYSGAQLATADGNFEEARQLYKVALVNDPLFLWAANNRAWLAATHPDRFARNDADAVAYALYACVKSDWHQWSFIDTLAAIYAENGDYESAVRCAERALSLAPVAGKQSIEESLVLYRRGQPRREGALDTAGPASGD